LAAEVAAKLRPLFGSAAAPREPLMAWVESHSPSFACRHSAQCTEDVARLLGSLEDLRSHLSDAFPRPVDNLTFIMHDGPRSLAVAAPMLAGVWRATDVTSRPYLTGWVSADDIHLLSPPALRARAAGNPMMAGVLGHSAATLYTRRVIVEANRDLHRSLGPARAAVSLRWAWLLEGASRWFSGESAAARPAVIGRLRGGAAPDFPPSLRDAPLLAGTVMELLVREEGERAAVELAGRLHPDGPRGALVKAFGGRPLVHTEGAWRSYLARLAYSA
jgi:hypothetical protein